ncbi:MAG: FAD-dependent oxidoreductase, partial [Actinomycetota bacterium]
MAVRFVIIGGGPAGHTAATHAARLGAEVTIVEEEIIGGAAHLRDCIPSKAMIATGGALAAVGRAHEMALTVASAEVDPVALRRRIEVIEGKLEHTTRQLLESQGVRLIEGRGRLVGPRSVVAETPTGAVEIEADAILLSTGSRPRLPDWAPVGG